MMRQQTSLVLGLVSWLALGVACSGTETDNPVSTGPESPIDFGTLPVPPGCPPSTDDAPPRDLPLWVHDSRRLVGWDQGALVVIDVSSPSAPSLLSKTPLAGYPRQVLLDGDTVTLVFAEWPMFDALPPRGVAELSTVTRLIRFDITAPAAPVRVADIALDGELWQVVPRAGGYWVMSARINPESLRCDVPQNICEYVDRQAIVLDHVTFDGSAFVRGERVELPYGQRAVAVAGGFATTTTGALHVAAFDGGGGLLPARDIPFEGYVIPYSPVAITPDYIAVLSSDLSIVSNDGTVLGTAPTAATGGNAGPQSYFVGEGVFTSNDLRLPGVYIDFSNPTAPVSTSLDRISEVLPIAPADGSAPTRALGWYQEANGLRFSLLSLETSPPSVLDDLTTADYHYGDSRAHLWVDGGRVFFAAHGRDNSLAYGALGIENDELTLQTSFDVEYADTLLGIGASDYVHITTGFSVRNAGGAASELTLNAGSPLDVAVSAVGEATLMAEADGSRRLDIVREGVVEAVVVSPQASRVVAAGDRWLVLSTLSVLQCSQSGNACDGYQPHVTIVGGSPASVLAEVALPDAVLPATGPLTSTTQRWLDEPALGSPLRLSDDRFVFVRDLDATCNTVEDCEALGIAASPVQPGTTPLMSACPPPPASCEPMPAPIPTASGQVQRRSFFVLDSASATLSAPLDLDASGSAYWSDRVSLGNAPSPETAFALRIEPTEETPGRTGQKARFVLERLQLGPDGALEHTGTNVVPGYPMAMLEAETLLSVQPTSGSNGDARLVRSRLVGDGVTIEDTRTIDARYGGFAVSDRYVVHLRLPSDTCEPVLTLESLSLDGSLAATGQVSLPGDQAAIVGAYGSEVIVVDGNQRAFTRVHVADDGALSVEAFATAPTYVSDPEWRAGVLYGDSPDGPYDAGVVRLPL